MEETGRRDDRTSGQTLEVPYHDLWTKPFRENTDPNFLWLGPQYRDAFAALRAAVLQNAGLLILTGDLGTGKTILARALADSLRAEGVRVGRLAYVGPHPAEFWNAVALALELPGVDDTHAGVPTHTVEFLQSAYARREKVLLVLDEAQDLAPSVLDEIDHLARAGLEAGRGKVNVINILLVGQPSIDSLISRRDPGGASRVVARLGPLPPEQVAEYIRFRLAVSGADRQLFASEAIPDIAAAAAGVPRLINRICDWALQVAAQRNETVVSAQIVEDTLTDFGLTPRGRARVSRRAPRRVAFAVALTLAVGLGVGVYHGRVGSNVHDHDRRPDQPPAESGIPVAPQSLSGSESAASASELASPGLEANPPALTPASTVPAAAEPRRAGISEGLRPERERPPIRPAVGTPRPDVSRVPKTVIPESRAHRFESERGASASPAVNPVKLRTPPVTVDRGTESGAGASGSATAASRREAGGSGESDDPAAIINWLLQGNRGTER